MQNIRASDDQALQRCHSERREKSNAETLRCAQGDNSGVPISGRLALADKREEKTVRSSDDG